MLDFFVLKTCLSDKSLKHFHDITVFNPMFSFVYFCKTGRRTFKCPHCPRTFIRANSDLQKHIWIHEGIKPFACPICPYACRSKNNLQVI